MKMMFQAEYRCFGADLQGKNERDRALDSKKLINR
jgi:hypothetical protein